jgi:flagellar transcriptional activator FlhD
MRGPSLLEEVKQVNFAYLSLIRDVAQREGVAGLRAIGMSEQASQHFVQLSDVQIEKLAGSGQLLCRFQMRTSDMLSSLGNPAENRIRLMASRELAAVAA